MLGASCKTGKRGANIPTVRDGSKKKSDVNQLPIIKRIGSKFFNLSTTKFKIKNGVTQISHWG